MQYLTVEQIKKQCVIDADFHDDDEYLEALGDTAEEIVEQQIDKSLVDVVSDNNGTLPAPLRHAMKMLVEYLYNNRGSDESDIPEAFYYMCKLYRSYN